MEKLLKNIVNVAKYSMDVMDMGDAMNIVAKMEHSDSYYVQEPITKEQEEQAIILNPEQLNLF